MKIGEFLHSKTWKVMQNYIYSWGASVVLIGALFKLQHYPGSGVFLGIGLSIEAIIFFVSAFEPMIEMPDWKTIYPQLRSGEEEPRQLEKYKKADSEYPNFFSAGAGGGGSFDLNLGGLPEDQLNALRDSFDKLSKTASGLKDISDATIATKGFVENINNASGAIKGVVDANDKVATSMNEGVDEITKSYKTVAETLKTSVSGVSENIKSTVTDLDSSVKESSKAIASYSEKLQNATVGLEKGSGDYTDNLDKLNKNVSAINAAYELHLKGASKVEEMVGQYTKGVGEMGKLLNSSVEETRKFNQNTKDINENIQALNDVYGRMLGALNAKK